MKRNNFQSIFFGGGCFWCSEAVFVIVKGVLKVTSGYAGGDLENPTYEQVSRGTTGHAEVIKVDYDPQLVNLEKLLAIFFSSHDPTSINRQGNDVGLQYRSIILYSSDEQKKIIEDYIQKIQPNYNKPLVTEVKELQKFYPAEGYHQEYFEKNPDVSYSQLVIVPKVKKIKKEFEEDIK